MSGIHYVECVCHYASSVFNSLYFISDTTSFHSIYVTTLIENAIATYKSTHILPSDLGGLSLDPGQHGGHRLYNSFLHNSTKCQCHK